MVKGNPQRFHFIAEGWRRTSLQSFPDHFVYEERPGLVKIPVLRHDKRRPSYGLRRR